MEMWLDLWYSPSLCLCIIVIIVIYKVLDRLIRIPYIIGGNDRYIFVTGCGSGFGFEIVKRLDTAGYHVFAGCHREVGEDNLHKVCSSRVVTIPLEVTKHESVLKAFNIVKEALPLDIGLCGVVNNAGVSGNWGPTDWLRIQDYNDVISTNLYGAIDVSKTFLPLVKRARGRIVNMSSMFGRATRSLGGPYCISKHGLEAFSDILRREVYPYGCSVHVIEPGYYYTGFANREVKQGRIMNMWNKVPPDMQQEYGEEYLKQLLMATNKRSYRVQDVADACEHALLGMFPRARYVLGTDAKFFWLPVQALPEWLGDWIHRIQGKAGPIPAVVS